MLSIPGILAHAQAVYTRPTSLVKWEVRPGIEVNVYKENGNLK